MDKILTSNNLYTNKKSQLARFELQVTIYKIKNKQFLIFFY